ncbi:hypothetical protein Q2T40_18680 [Winogradskyella maritima]|uniref:Outer membrane protein with beta-barrel domain n=1 Tax=Winogradskyella maritima TaxID=1517766 RepID=A0ABV8AGS7_9FLAO|nr:hypothetical protein [Winogradskyella maritima]
MKLKQLYLLVALTSLFVTTSHAQRYNIQNGIGIYGGLTQFDLKTDNFTTQSNNGFLGGMAATVDLPHKFYNLSYNIQLSENKFDVAATPAIGPSEFVEYKLFMAQAALVMHVKLAGKYLTADLGPMIQYNGNMQLVDESQESYIIDGYTALRADDILDINQFNINGTVGLTAGIDNFKVRAQYIYGFTNTLNKLNKQDLNVENDNNFKGNISMLVFSLMVSF